MSNFTPQDIKELGQFFQPKTVTDSRTGQVSLPGGQFTVAFKNAFVPSYCLHLDAVGPTGTAVVITRVSQDKYGFTISLASAATVYYDARIFTD